MDVPLDDPIKDEGQDYMDMGDLIAKKVEDLSISAQEILHLPLLHLKESKTLIFSLGSVPFFYK